MAAPYLAAGGARTTEQNAEDYVKCHGLLQSNLGDVLFHFNHGSALQQLFGASGTQYPALYCA